MKRKFLTIFVMVVALLLLSAITLGESTTNAATNLSQKHFTIGVCIPAADHGWTAGLIWWAKKSIAYWQQKYPNITFYLDLAANSSQQVSQVQDLMAKGIDALVINAYTSAPLTPVVGEAFHKGIYVVSVDRGLTEPYQDVYIAGDNPGLGRVSAEYLVKALNGKGNIVILQGLPCEINTERVNAFMDVIKNYPDIHVLASQLANWSSQDGFNIMQTYLTKFPKIDAVWAQDDDTLLGVLQAYQASGRNDIKFFIGGAGSKIMIKKVMDHDPLVPIDVLYPDTLAADGISIAVMHLEGQMFEGFWNQQDMPSEIILPSTLITPENAKNFYFPDSPY